MNPYTVIIVATKGRPQHISNLLDALASQTVQPDEIIVSACDSTDVAQCDIAAKNVRVIFGSPGSSTQRNRALSFVRTKSDIIIFFDDDFIPSQFWVEHIQALLTAQPDIVCVTGQVLIDGVKTGGLPWSDGLSTVNEADLARKMPAISDYKILNDHSAYGCNMALRGKNIDNVTFDERLALYGWLEDRDFSFWATTTGRRVWTDAVWGVHLGATRGRTSGVRFGYSQVVNPWYLMTKGSMTPVEACRYIFRALAANTLGCLFWNSHVDRWGRLKGNAIGVKDLLFGRWAPERVEKL